MEQTTTQEKNTFKDWINEKISQSDGLRLAVYNDLSDYDTLEDAISHLNDVSKYGGSSGAIPSLIYYTDTIKFYDENEEEIEQILEDFKENCGFKSRPEAIANLNGSAESIDEEKNLLAWMGYEETARLILEELENEDIN